MHRRLSTASPTRDRVSQKLASSAAAPSLRRRRPKSSSKKAPVVIVVIPPTRDYHAEITIEILRYELYNYERVEGHLRDNLSSTKYRSYPSGQAD